MPNWLDDAFVNEGMALTQQYEGFRPTPYKDTKGIPTIGYGFNLNAYPELPRKMNQTQASEIMKPIYLEALDRAIRFSGENWGLMTPDQQRILTDMSYNLGDKLFEFKEMQKAIGGGDFNRVPLEMKNSEWFNQVGRRSKEHIKNWLK